MKITLALYSDNEAGRTSLPNWPAEKCDVPGLAVCYVPTNSPEGEGYQANDGTWVIPAKQYLYPSRYYYQVIHVNSGVAVICDLTNRSLAFVSANRLSDLDWTVHEEEIKNNPDYKRLVRSTWDGTQ